MADTADFVRLASMPVRMWQDKPQTQLRRCMRCYSTQVTAADTCTLPHAYYGTCGGPLLDVTER